MKSTIITILVWSVVSLTFSANGHPVIANGQMNWLNYFSGITCTILISFIINELFTSKND